LRRVSRRCGACGRSRLPGVVIAAAPARICMSAALPTNGRHRRFQPARKDPWLSNHCPNVHHRLWLHQARPGQA
jgi:hypothetical protein